MELATPAQSGWTRLDTPTGWITDQRPERSQGVHQPVEVGLRLFWNDVEIERRRRSTVQHSSDASNDDE
ncbi:MAG: hypothetical protein AAGF11_34700 [Myxococcota bacterium]